MNRLSHSSIKTYSECGEKWRLHYRERLREPTRSGALSFGTAIDKATEFAIKHPEADEYAVFDNVFTMQDINGALECLIDSLLCVYASSDFNARLLTAEDKSLLIVKAQQLLSWKGADILELYDELKAAKAQKAYKHFSDSKQRMFNAFNWYSMRRKGHLMLKANREKVLPHFTKIVGTQVEIGLGNEKGDTVIGFADVVAHWDNSSDALVLDYKTATRPYDKDAVLTSPQLALYCNALNLARGGFIVFSKTVTWNLSKVCGTCSHDGNDSRAKTCDATINGKRCGSAWIETVAPEIEVQILIDTIPKRTSDIVLANIEMANKGIDAGVFIRNFDSCEKPWGRCPYYDMCHKNKSEGLVLLPEEKK